MELKHCPNINQFDNKFKSILITMYEGINTNMYYSNFFLPSDSITINSNYIDILLLVLYILFVIIQIM